MKALVSDLFPPTVMPLAASSYNSTSNRNATNNISISSSIDLPAYYHYRPDIAVYLKHDFTKKIVTSFSIYFS
jgi:hypothetical protein